jgi:hypothetical protein
VRPRLRIWLPSRSLAVWAGRGGLVSGGTYTVGTVDEFILQALKGGPVTVNDIGKRFETRVRMRLNKLRVRGIVLREGRGRAPKIHLLIAASKPRREGDRREGRPHACKVNQTTEGLPKRGRDHSPACCEQRERQQPQCSRVEVKRA